MSSVTVTKIKIADHLNKKLGFSSSICKEIVDEFFLEMFALTYESRNLSLPNFGTWKVSDKGVRKGFDIQKHQHVTIESMQVFKFLPSLHFKQEINDKSVNKK